MAEKTVEQRLAQLEAELTAHKARADKAQARNEALKSELKQTRAAFSDHRASSARAMGALNSMQDLIELRRNGSNPYDLGDDETPRERKERLMKETVKTKDGRRHYFIEKPAHVSENGGSPIYYECSEGGRVISVPEDHVPSITWQPVEVAGKDQLGKLVFVPKGALTKEKDAQTEDDGSNAVADPGAPTTNTQLNQQRAASQEKLAKLGPGSGSTPAPLAQPPRPSDTTVG